jgi:hypothetical protein
LLENQRKFDSWLEANAVLGFILFLGIMAMTLAGLNSAGRQDATEVVSSITSFEMRAPAAPENLAAPAVGGMASR